MHLLDLILIAIGLSMDACAVSIVNGLSIPKLKFRHALLIALAFGGFQGIMPVIGYLVGERFAQAMSRCDHWIAFLLLGWIGGKMIWDVWKGGDEEEEAAAGELTAKLLLLQAVATSIDALAVGVSFAAAQVNIVTAALLIAATTFGLSLAAVYVGKASGAALSSKATLLGGIILVGIGLKIWVEHMFLS